MPFITPVRSFRAFSLGLAACVFVLPAASAQGETIKSDRTARDVDDSAAAQQADLKAVAATATGNYVDAGGIPFTYRVYAPPAKEPGAKYPMYIYWGTDVPLILRSSQARYPCYVVSVNCGPKVADWKARSASALRVVAETLIAKDPQIDASRIYTGGFSKCGGAAWMAVLSYPDFFAAIIPSGATCDVSKAPLVASRKMGVWMFLGEKDGIFRNDANKNNAVYMTAAIVAAGGNCRYTQYPRAAHHEFWLSDSPDNPKWNDFSATREWLFKQQKPKAAWPIIDSPVTATGKVDTAFRYQITAGNNPARFAATELPPGLSLDVATGVISGTPTAAGTAFVTLSAGNAKGAGVSTLMLTVTGGGAPGSAAPAGKDAKAP